MADDITKLLEKYKEQQSSRKELESKIQSDLYKLYHSFEQYSAVWKGQNEFKIELTYDGAIVNFRSYPWSMDWPHYLIDISIRYHDFEVTINIPAWFLTGDIEPIDQLKQKLDKKNKKEAYDEILSVLEKLPEQLKGELTRITSSYTK